MCFDHARSMLGVWACVMHGDKRGGERRRGILKKIEKIQKMMKMISHHHEAIGHAWNKQWRAQACWNN